jgi:hypothetical protein
MSLTKVTYSMTQGSPVNAYDFLTPAEIADVQSFAPTLNVTAALQAAIDACQPGQRLYIPYGFYKHTGLTVNKSIFIYGDLPAPFFDDDSWNALNKGTILWQYASTGNNLTVEPPNLGERRLTFHIEYITFVGAIWNGSAFSGTPTSGHGLYVNGRDGLAETQVIISWEQIGACWHAENGVFLTGSIYGCDAGMVTSIANGKNNLRVKLTVEPIGEMTISHVRCFGGGSLASTDIDKSCVYLAPGGLMNIGFITATGGITFSVLLGSGRFNIGSIQTETIGGTVDASRVIIQLGDGTSTPSGSEIGLITSNPGNAYPGTVVKFKAGSRGNRIQQLIVGDAGATGDLVIFDSDAESNAVYFVRGTTTGDLVDDNGNFNIYSQFYSIPTTYTANGLWTSQDIGIGKFNAGNVSAGSIGHGFFADGTANFSISSSTAGGIAYLECNNNAAVPDGYKFHSFRIGTSPTEIGKIEVASSGTAINYATSSDYRLKENISPMTGALEKLSMLKPVTYTWKRTGTQGQGFIAHELQEVFPDAVTGEKDGTVVEKIYEKDPTGKTFIHKEVVVPNYQGVDTSHLVATLVAAVQELNAKIDSLTFIGDANGN